MRVKFFLKKLATYNNMGEGLIPFTNKAVRLLIGEMSTEKGFSRHDGSDYFVHPIAVTQTLIDFEKVKFYTGSNLTKDEKRVNYESDVMLTTALLHDIIEDVGWVYREYIIKEYDEYVYQNIDNVTKREGESMEEYIKRFSSDRISAIVKVTDRLNNVSTLSESSVDHRKRQLEETNKYYLPLTKEYRYLYFEDSSFYWQARTIMQSILKEVARCMEYEEE